MLFDFMLNGRLVLALARQNPEPIIDALRDTPKLPAGGQWATFLRNHDEIDLSRLTAEQRADVFDAVRARRRPCACTTGASGAGSPPMLGNDRRRLELAYSLQFTLRGTPVLRYGEEIGMGDDLNARGPQRHPHADAVVVCGSTAASPRSDSAVPPGDRRVAPYGYEKVNVTAQRHDPRLAARLVRADDPHAAREPRGGLRPVHARRRSELPPNVLVHRADGTTGTMVFLHNLGTEQVRVDLGSQFAESDFPNQVFGDQDYPDVGKLDALDLGPYGYRWIRLRRLT